MKHPKLDDGDATLTLESHEIQVFDDDRWHTRQKRGHSAAWDDDIWKERQAWSERLRGIEMPAL